MANNRLYLYHPASGERVFLAKRMGEGWHTIGEELNANLDRFFHLCSEKGGFENQDNFYLMMENTGETSAPIMPEK